MLNLPHNTDYWSPFRPGEIRFSDALPKTRSGKIMRWLRSLAAGEEVTGDTSTLEDRSVLDKLREGA
ncbi:hypothetical protein RIF25_08435 [Thermosynechococcaceae cyanobacterium BACA0444]|uniref:Acetyl-coenzyme A synthetase n=1 Tax=Pseudocalidococcus azoricus BACA0444 TaxID=2918990 RepID=A0AAE4FRI9_9CYAN|nr:hypothetical protein [Pseudocalidococcus azoricus]MDS3860840.1 hypothetical protein [Pseudocalidococcus azoricus BACA0444]